MNLYHYTSQAGLLGILKSRGVWATDTRFLNDATEIVHALSAAREMVSEIFMHDDYRAAFGWVLNRALHEMESRAVFVTSFSEKPDLLSQWRGYCPSGAGVCVGFDKDGIENFCREHGYQFEKCIYDSQALEQRIVDIIDACEEKLPSAGMTREEYSRLSAKGQAKFETDCHLAFTEGPEKDIAKAALIAACEEIITLAPLFKHPGFREESEWRIVATEPVDIPLYFRAGPSYLCPYIEAKILEEKATLRRVIVGPNPNQHRANISVGMLLAFEGYESVEVTSSSLPFNNW